MLSKQWTALDGNGLECSFEPTGYKMTYCGRTATSIAVIRTDAEGQGWNCGTVFVGRSATRADIERQFFSAAKAVAAGAYGY